MCIFPSLEYNAPSFAADLVSLPGGHLIALDWAPNGIDWSSPNHSSPSSPASRLASVFRRHRALLPDGGEVPPAAARYFSECFLFTRLPR